MTQQTEVLRLAELLETDGWPDAAAELRRLEHNNQLLKNALWKACGDDEEMVKEIIKSQGELK